MPRNGSSPASYSGNLAYAQMRATQNIWEVSALAILTILLFSIYTINQYSYFRITIITGSIALTLIVIGSAMISVRRASLNIWNPLFWFRISVGTYFGIGSLAPYIVESSELAAMYAVYPFDDRIALKVLLISATSVLCVVFFSYVLIGLRIMKPKAAPLVSIGKFTLHPSDLLFLFLGLGLALRYGIMVPYTFGLSGDLVVPGSVGTLADCFYVGIFLAIRHAVLARGFWPFLVAGLVALDAAVSVCSFSKTELLTLMIFVFLGIISNRASVARALIGGFLVIYAYVAFQPLVQFGRQEVYATYGSISGASIGERLQIVERFLKGEARQTRNLHGLTRLSYVNASAFVVDQYDTGIPGRTFSDAIAVLIPRALWKDKPNITRHGGDLYFLVTGNRGSAMGVGTFAEAYWNFGWLGIPFIMALLSVILVTFSRFSMWVMASESLIYLPVVLVGVQMGTRTDGHFVPDVLGPSWIALILGFAIHFGAKLVGTDSRASRTRGARR